ncbi:MAG: M24 family metallopeptidase [Anaerolineales bacterium]
MTPSDAQITIEKLDQAVQLLQQHGVDLWITFVRETMLLRDPAFPLVCPFDMVWQSAFLVSRTGDRMAVVGRFDVENLKRTSAYTEIVPYDESIRPALTEAVKRLDPKRIAVNVSTGDPAADGLTHGMYKLLLDILDEAGYADYVESAESFLGSLRGRKTPAEIARIRQAIRTTEMLYGEVAERIEPGLTEQELAAYLHDRVQELNLETAWDWDFCPAVNTGPDTAIGHAGPGELITQSGHLLHFDFGVQQNGFCSDLQRMWYLPAAGEPPIPDDVQHAWDVARGALLAGVEALTPGARGWEVDAAARAYIVAHGYPEYLHAFGHHIGRSAHDGATTLGPRWDRYGQTPFGVIESGNCFAVELGVFVEGRGYMYLEENVLVTDDGVEWLSTPQEELWIVD